MQKPPRKDAHPLYRSYHRMIYSARRDPHGLDPRWEDFWLFLEDVGERPEGKILYRKDRSKPYGPDNWMWTSKMTRMLANLPPNVVARLMGREREAVKAKWAGVNCPQSNRLFNQIKRKPA